VKKCTEINELLSAYSDNELTASEKLSVEEHLAACESCSALLEIYREISISVDESSVSVPEALRIGVMNRIRSENISTEKENVKKKWWQHQVLLTRIAPIAACLAVVVLVWQFGSNTDGGRNLFSMDNLVAPEDAAMPAMAPAPAPGAASPDSVRTMSDDLDSDDDSMVTDEVRTGSGAQADSPDGTTESESFETAPARLWPYGDDESDDIDEKFSDFLMNAYAEITITGAFPEFLTSYEPLPIENWQGWELVFEIPSTEIDSLMLELLNRRSSLVRNHVNYNSQYAIVFYSP